MAETPKLAEGDRGSFAAYSGAEQSILAVRPSATGAPARQAPADAAKDGARLSPTDNQGEVK